MWKYITNKDCQEFLLSLRLIDCLDDSLYIKKINTIAHHVKDHYAIFRIPKRNHKFRYIYEPDETLKYIQRQILSNILNNKNISTYATAYYAGSTIVGNASPHIGKKMILKLDIKNFFSSIDFVSIYEKCFSLAYFPENVGLTLTHLVTYDGYLPQGAPTSAAISNIIMKECDEVIGEWCKERNITYTRYSDDMTFSGDFSVNETIQFVKKSIYPMCLNKEKIHVIKKNKCQNVTGLVVNEKVQVCKKYRKKIRQEMYYIKKYGVCSHVNRIGVDIENYLSSLYGKILFVLQIDSTNKEFLDYKKEIKKRLDKLI